MSTPSQSRWMRLSRLGAIIAWLRAEERRAFRVQIAVVFIITTLLNIGFYYQREVRDMDIRNNLQRVVHGWDGLAWYVWMAAAPAILWLVRRFPLARDNWVRGLIGLMGGSFGIYLVVSNARFLIRWASFPRLPAGGEPVFSGTNYLHTQSVLMPIDFLAYCSFFAAALSIDYYFKHRQRADEVVRLQLQAARLQSELTRAQLTLLRGQLHPHFLFNAFNAVATLVRQRKNELAVEMIAQLGELLRLTIENIDLQEQSVEQEFDFALRYLEVERVRFCDKLRTEVELAPSARGCIVPNLLLHPLVENAVKHGISQRVDSGLVRLTAVRSGNRLLMEVIDDGSGVAPVPGRLPAGGLGLGATRSRLDHAYGANYGLDIVRRPEGGTIVRLDLPWRERPGETARALAAASA